MIDIILPLPVMHNTITLLHDNVAINAIHLSISFIQKNVGAVYAYHYQRLQLETRYVT